MLVLWPLVAGWEVRRSHCPLSPLSNLSHSSHASMLGQDTLLLLLACHLSLLVTGKCPVTQQHSNQWEWGVKDWKGLKTVIGNVSIRFYLSFFIEDNLINHSLIKMKEKSISISISILCDPKKHKYFYQFSHKLINERQNLKLINIFLWSIISFLINMEV